VKTKTAAQIDAEIAKLEAARPWTHEELHEKVIEIVGRKRYVDVSHSIRLQVGDGSTFHEWKVYHEDFGGGGFDGKTAREAFELFVAAEKEARRYGEGPAAKEAE